MQDAFAIATSPLRSCERPFSFFQLIDSLALQDVQGKNISAAVPLHRFCSLMRKMGARSFVQERLQLNQELLDEQVMLSEACNTSAKLDVRRLTVFRSEASKGVWSDQALVPEADLLGYAVVVRVVSPQKIRASYVFEAVVRPPSLIVARNSPHPMVSEVGNYYIHNSRLFVTSLGPMPPNNREMRLRGSFFAQQNAVTHVCAHAALRMAINSSPRFERNLKLTNKKINEILKLPWDQVPKGLDLQQMKAVIDDIGGSVQLADFYAKPAMEYDHFVYPLMESGCPVILNVHGRSFLERRGLPISEELGHALAVMGHTINSDRWEPEARGGYGSYPKNPYLPAAQWTDHLIINDDNFGMYVTLPCDSLRNLLIPQKNPALHAAVALGVVPRSVRLSGYMAEQRAASIAGRLQHGMLKPEPLWLERLIDGPIVCRTQLQTRSQYIAHLRQIFQLNGVVLNTAADMVLTKQLPPKLWITELSLPNLYSANKHKVGEVVLDAGSSEAAHESGKSLVAVRLPGYLFMPPSTNHTLALMVHAPLIMEDSKNRLCDW